MSASASKDTAEQAEFRSYCQQWLQHNQPGPSRCGCRRPLGSRPTELDYLCAWQKAAYEAGLVGCDYPRDTVAVGAAIQHCQRSAAHWHAVFSQRDAGSAWPRRPSSIMPRNRSNGSCCQAAVG
jgi:hypothetical protein